MKKYLLVFGIMIVAFTMIAFAQETPTVVTLTTPDGITLIGDFYAAESPAPTLLLLHMAYTWRGVWSPSIPTFLEAGYNVLAVDMRGWGDSGGDQDMDATIADFPLWFEWLRGQPTVLADQFAVIGGSVGANLSLFACVNEPGCVTVVALSPGRDYFGVQPLNALADNAMRGRSLLILTALRDSSSGTFPQELVAESNVFEVGLIQYSGVGHHGTDILDNREDALPLIMTWLETHIPAI